MPERFHGTLIRIELAPIPLWLPVLLVVVAALVLWWWPAAMASRGAASPRAKRTARGAHAASEGARARLVGASALVASLALLSVDAWAFASSGATQHSVAYNLVRVGSLDVSLGFDLDALAAFGCGAACLAGLAAIVGSARGRLDPAATRRFVVAALGGVAGVELLALADNMLVALMGWQLAGLSGAALIGARRERYPDAAAGLRVFALGRAGDALLLGAIALTFWGLGGTWPGTGRYLSDYRARFIAVHRDSELQTAKLAPLEDVGKKGYLTFTSHPGAPVFLGVADEAQLAGNPTATGVSPFVKSPVPAGAHMIAIVPGGAASVGGDGQEAALIELVRVGPDEEVTVIPVGPTVTFRELGDQLRVLDEQGQSVLAQALSQKRAMGDVSLTTAIALLFFLGLGAKSLLVPVAGLAPGWRRAPWGSLALSIALGCVLPGPLFAARMAPLLSLGSVGWMLTVAGALTAVWGAVATVGATDLRRVFAGVLACHGGVVASGVGVSAFGAAGVYAAGSAVLLVIVGAALAAASSVLPARDGALLWPDLAGLERAHPRAKLALSMAGGVLLVGAPAAALGEIVALLATSQRAGGVVGIVGAGCLILATVQTTTALSRALATSFGGELPKRLRKLAKNPAPMPPALLGVAAAAWAVSGLGLVSALRAPDAVLSFAALASQPERVSAHAGGFATALVYLGALVLAVAGWTLTRPRDAEAVARAADADPRLPSGPFAWARGGDRIDELGRRLFEPTLRFLRRLAREVEVHVVALPLDIAAAAGGWLMARLESRGAGAVRAVAVVLGVLALVALSAALAYAGGAQ